MAGDLRPELLESLEAVVCKLNLRDDGAVGWQHLERVENFYVRHWRTIWVARVHNHEKAELSFP